MSKKHYSGFISIKFKLSGKISIPVGLVLVVLWLMATILDWNVMPLVILFIGIMFIIIGLYLLFVVPKE